MIVKFVKLKVATLKYYLGSPFRESAELLAVGKFYSSALLIIRNRCTVFWSSFPASKNKIKIKINNQKINELTYPKFNHISHKVATAFLAIFGVSRGGFFDDKRVLFF